MLQFKVKGNSFTQAVRLVMIERNQTRITENSLWEINPNKWSLLKGYFDIGAPFSESLGTITNDPITITWKMDDEMDFSTFIPARIDQQIFFRNAWGQRYRDNRDFGATLPYFFINRDLNEPVSTWVTVYEGYNKSQGIVRSVELVDDDKGNVVVRIDTKDGYDYVSSCFSDESTVKGFGLKSDGKVAVINNGKPRLYNGKILEFNDQKIMNENNEYSGNVIDNGNSENKELFWYDIECDIDIKSIKANQVLFVNGDDGISRGYPIQYATNIGKNVHRIFVKSDSRGFKTYPAKKWRIVQLSTDYNKDDFSTNKESDAIFNTGAFSNSNAKDENENGHGNGGNKMSKGVIIAIVIVVIVVIVAAVIIGVVYYIKRNRQNSSTVEI